MSVPAPTSTAGDVAAQLSALPSDGVVAAVSTALTAKIGAARASELSVLVAFVLDSDEHVARLQGAPTRVADHLDLEARVQQMRAVAHRRILDTPMLTSAGVAQALGAAATNRQAASGPRREGRLLGLPQGRSFVFPAFQIDTRAERIYGVVEEVNTRLNALGDPWGVASWWLSPTPRLHGQAPADLTGAGRDDDLLTLADAERDE